jgi:2-amino-4-hydroxy-6-hydroxymethyldihydropteridine diphosphokinase
MAYLGLGSNQRSCAGGPAETVAAAISRLSDLGEIQSVSSFYETAPVGFQDQPAFTNAALLLRTRLDPAALLDQLLSIEREFGRDRTATTPKGPRSLDLDILMMDDLVLNSSSLTIPHPALADRRFVLTPLSEIAPQLVHPLLSCTMEELLSRLPDEGENRQAAVRVAPGSFSSSMQKG